MKRKKSWVLETREFCEKNRGGSQIPEGPVKVQDYPAEVNTVVGCFMKGRKRERERERVCVCVAYACERRRLRR